MAPLPSRTLTSPSTTAGLSGCSAVFLPPEPPRPGRVAFWRPDGTRPIPLPAGTAGEARTAEDDGIEELPVALPDGTGEATERLLPALVLPVAEAVPLLTGARASGSGSSEAADFWGAAAVLALQLAARGRLLPGIGPEGHDAWRLGPLDPEDTARLRDLAAAMPPHAHAVPLPGLAPLRLPEPEGLLRGFLNAVADALPRTPAAAIATGGPAFADERPRPVPSAMEAWGDPTPSAVEAWGGPTPSANGARGGPNSSANGAWGGPNPGLREWAAGVAAGHDAGVRLSLRVEMPGLTDDTGTGTADRTGSTLAAPGPFFRAVLQLHSLADPALIADAADVWAGGSTAAEGFGPQVRTDTLLTLRRAAAAWEALGPLLSAAVPDSVELTDEEITELLNPAVTRALDSAGVQVHWPRELARQLTARAVVGPGEAEFDAADPGPDGTDGTDRTARGTGAGGSGTPSLLSPDALLTFSWRYAIGDQELTRSELDRLAEAGRPLVRLRDRWVLVDPEALRGARERRDRKLTTLEALGSVLAGSVPAGPAGPADPGAAQHPYGPAGPSRQHGEWAEVRASGWLETLREQLADPERTGPDSIPQPAALAADLRDYQLRGLNWLHRMTSLGLGGCLADDMGLGKTIMLIALHLHRQLDPATAGPTLVVCPASLMGNWQREIEKFAPGTPVRRYHGGSRSLADLADGEFVLTTYGTMRLDAPRLAEPAGLLPWGLVVADEAQHVKNPFSATARQLRTIPARARVALTGTPVENSLSDLWAVLDWTTPGLLGRLGTFRRRHAAAVEGGADPAAAARLAGLVRPFLLRRRKSDPGIAPELPPKTETDRAVALSTEQAGLYEAVVRETLAEISGTEGFSRRGLVVKLLTALKQICNHPAHYLKEDGPGPNGRSGKLELLDELLDTILSEGASVLVFTQYVAMARLLEKHLATRGVHTECLHGGTPVAQREELVRRFQNGDVPVFLLSLKAAGTGLNLTRAEHVVHFDRWWNPAVEAQATDRAHRIGQTRPVQVHRLITEGTIEDRIATMLERKQALADAVLGSGEAAFTELTDAELAELVELRGTER